MASTNLTYKDIKNWKTNVSNSISTNLCNSLSVVYQSAIQLSNLTKASSDENNLSYRYKDLATLVNTANTKIKSFMTSFNTDLDAYLKVVNDAEQKASEEVRKQIDQFQELASEIGKLKM